GGERLRVALRDLYAWFRETEPMTANVLRDAQLLPALRQIVEGGMGAYAANVNRLLAEPFGGGKRVEAAVQAVAGFEFWRAPAPRGRSGRTRRRSRPGSRTSTHPGHLAERRRGRPPRTRIRRSGGNRRPSRGRTARFRASTNRRRRGAAQGQGAGARTAPRDG